MARIMNQKTCYTLYAIEQGRIVRDVIVSEDNDRLLGEHLDRLLGRTGLESYRAYMIRMKDSMKTLQFSELELLAQKPDGWREWNSKLVACELVVSGVARIDGRDHAINEQATAARWTEMLKRGVSYQRCVEGGPLLGMAVALVPSPG